MDRIRGAIARIEAQWSHTEFARAVAPPYAMLSVIHARHLLKRGETAASYYPDETQVITTTTIADERLHLLSWEDEYEILREFQPAYHIPSDYPVYGDDPPEDRQRRSEQCATGTIWMADQIDELDVDIRILPLVKGAEKRDREWGYRACEALGTDLAAVYAAQYFLASGGGGQPSLLRDLEAIERETNGDLDVVVVGLLSSEYLAELPENVIAAAGQRAWREPVAPRKQDAEAMRSVYAEIATDVAAALGTGQSDTDVETQQESVSGDESDATTPAD